MHSVYVLRRRYVEILEVSRQEAAEVLVPGKFDAHRLYTLISYTGMKFLDIFGQKRFV